MSSRSQDFPSTTTLHRQSEMTSSWEGWWDQGGVSGGVVTGPLQLGED